jgi:hypothetical protein
LTFRFSGDPAVIEKKVTDLLDRGVEVTFQPGEILVIGSKLFEAIEHVGCSLQSGINLPGTLTLICQNLEGKELARLSDVPGQFTGGLKEIWFDGGLVNSSFTSKLGPIGPAMGGSLQLNLNFHRWNGQNLLQLAYFDRLFQFFHTLPISAGIVVECEHDGNRVFSHRLALPDHSFSDRFVRLFENLSKARKVAHRFNINPLWTNKKYNRETQQTVDQLHAVFFEDGWSEPMPRMRLTATFTRKTFRFDNAELAANGGLIRLVTNYVYSFFGEEIDVGKLARDFTHTSIEIPDAKNATRRNAPKSRKKKKGAKAALKGGTITVYFNGTESTVMTLRLPEPEEK